MRIAQVITVTVIQRSLQVLERLDPNPKYYEGKRGACIGYLQLLIASDSKSPRDKLDEVVSILKASTDAGAEAIVRTIRKWSMANGMRR